MNYALIAERIKKLCKDRNISINFLISTLELNKSFIYDIEKRNMSPSAERIAKIAQYFNVTIDYLLGNDKIEQKEKPTTDESDEPVLETEDEKVNRILLDLFSELPEQQQKSVIDMMEFFLNKNKSKKHEN